MAKPPIMIGFASASTDSIRAELSGQPPFSPDGHKEACRGQGHVHALAVIGDRHGMQFVLLAVLEIPWLPGAILLIAEVEEAAVGEQASRVGTLVERRTADVLQTESGEHSRFWQHLSRVLVSYRHHDHVGN